MARALALAWQGWGRVHPNPMVGAVVLARGGAVVGEGWHAEFGGTHAEPMALAAAGTKARGATLVVSLEPCAHGGKQPPCVDAILKAGVRRVVAALPDPNPVAAGGAARLRAAGVDVTFGALAEEAARQNAAFLHTLRDSTRPYVSLKLAASLDGRIADRDGRSRWVSGPEAREWVQWLRAGMDAVAVGAETARKDDPSLTARGSVHPRVPPRRIVFTRSHAVPATLSLIRTAREVPTMVAATTDAAARAAKPLERHGVEVVRGATLAATLTALGSAGITNLLVEGGGKLAGALLQENLVDRIYWIQSPMLLGEHGVAAVAGLSGKALARTDRWTVAGRRALGQDTLTVLDRR